MAFGLSTLAEWNTRSARRQWLLMASRQLLSMVRMAEIGTRETFDMVAWHWSASAMWLCTRSDSVLKVKKTLAIAFARSIDDLYGLASGKSEDETVQHKAVVLLRRLCALLSLHAGNPTELFSTSTARGNLLIALVAFMSAPTTRGVAVEMIRRLVLGQRDSVANGSEPVLLLSQGEAEAFVSMIQRRTTGKLSADVASTLAELCLRAGVPTHDDLSSSDSAEATFWLSIVRHALDSYSEISSFDKALRTQWLRDTTNAVLLIAHRHSDKAIRTLAVMLMPKLDPVLCIRFVASTLLLQVDTTTSGQLVAFLFECAERQQTTKDVANAFVDSLCRGVPPLAAVKSPSGFVEKAFSFNIDGEHQAAVLAKSRDGWCVQVNQNTQIVILSVLIGKIFGAPRDTVLVTWLRELSCLGWFDAPLAEVLPVVTMQMRVRTSCKCSASISVTNVLYELQTVQKLSEEMLEDDSPRTARAVEHLLFARLAPSLVLRVIPRSAFLSLYASSPCRLLESHFESSKFW
jgi:hypothetical protein